MEACSSRSGDFDLVRWYEAATIQIGDPTRNPLEIVLGIWESPHDITFVNIWKEDAFVVRHEMLHELLRGDVDHKDEAWSACSFATEGSAGNV